MHLLETVAGGLSLVGFVMISAGKRSGFGVGLMASVCGLVLFLEHEMYGMAALQVAYERGPIFWTGKLMLIYQLVRRVHETHTPPYFHGRI